MLAVALLIPIFAVNALVFFWPTFNLFKMSFIRGEATGALTDETTLANWTGLFRDSFYSELLVSSVTISLVITALTLVLSYPIALYLHRARGLRRTVLLVLVISPLLTSAVVRTYGWIAILSDGGLVNSLLKALGLPAQRLIFNTQGVVLGLAEILMPYMILALLAGFGRLDARLEEAAATLGARPRQAFWRVVLPLSLPGVMLGCLLCFVLAVSSFITPKLLGGGRVFLLATEIYDQAIVTLNWPLAATLSMVVLIVFGLALALYARAARL
ncbi:MAG: ABC transporter permease [Rhizobiales bacterium]|nr:ABC transporter permease [Hyphomicrobiales bacterium]